MKWHLQFCKNIKTLESLSDTEFSAPLPPSSSSLSSPLGKFMAEKKNKMSGRQRWLPAR